MTDERGLRVENLYKSYDDKNTQVAAVTDVSFEVPEGSFYTLLGPSGCGKTTTLRCVAGLEKPNSGHIVLEGNAVWSSRLRAAVPPHRRDIGMVFQSYAIWPHMSVFDNVAFPLKVGSESVPKARMREQVEEALAMVQLHGYESRMATQLSGGQQQRLALARALVRRPKLLLLDEPLSNLDAKLREELRTELRNLQRQLGITTLYVTHDQAEALSMSNMIAVMSEGRIVQESSPRTIYQRPNSRFVATFVGGTNFVDARVLSTNGGDGFTLQSPLGSMTATCPDGTCAGEEVTVAVRPENIRVHLDNPAAVNVFAGTVEQVVFLGEYLDCRVRVGETLLFTRQHPTSPISSGDDVYVELPVSLCAVLSDERGTASAAALSESDKEPAAGHAGR